MKAATIEYLDGIREGRALLREYGPSIAESQLESLNTLCRMFDASSPIGQCYRGERDFWRNQVKRAAER